MSGGKGSSNGLSFPTGGWGWTEFAKENQTGTAGPGLHSFLVPTPATLSNFTTIHYRTRRK